MTAHLPVLTESGLSQYLDEVKKFPVLTEEEEQTLANRWADDGDVAAAHKLVTSHLRLVVKIAMGYRGYGLPVTDLISEGNVGLMQAVKRFEPQKGNRLSTYAMWWIKAAINEYVLRSWSLVKMGTTAAQKKLFYNLRRLRNRIQNGESRDLTPAEITQVSQELDVPERDVIEMDQRLGAHDSSLNAKVGDESDDSWIDYLEDDSANQEVIVLDRDEKQHRQALVAQAMTSLNDREKDILQARRLEEPPLTLEDLSQKYKISRERVRQIENRALEKLQEKVLGGLLPSPS